MLAAIQIARDFRFLSKSAGNLSSFVLTPSFPIGPLPPQDPVFFWVVTIYFPCAAATTKPIKAMENIDVLNEEGAKTGEVLPRKEVHRQGKLHRAVHLYLFNQEKRLLLQRRTAHTDHYPGMWSISVTGHVDAGEESWAAVQRELKEELGMDVAAQDFTFLFTYRRDAELRPTYIDRQFHDVYACWVDFEIDKVAFDKTAVSEVKLVSLAEFEQMVDAAVALAPVYGDACKRVVAMVQPLAGLD